MLPTYLSERANYICYKAFEIKEWTIEKIIFLVSQNIILPNNEMYPDIYHLSFCCPSQRFREHFCSKVLLPISRSFRTLPIVHVQYIKILTWLWSFIDEIANFRDSIVRQFQKRLEHWRIEIWPKSLGVLLEFLNMERGLLAYFKDIARD